MTIEPGAKLGPYEIIEPAGVGGMGEVFKARDTRLERTVAIKVLPAGSAMNEDLRARFEREAKIISSLNHPHICTLYDIGNEAGRDYLVMEFIEGETLSERLKKGAIPTNEVLSIASEISDALDKAHRQGLIHRDLKPGNVMLTREGAKLLDFGLAKSQFGGGAISGVSAITQTTPLTGAGTIMGTMQYMAPELLDGSVADARSDIFAFGVMLYEMLTGQRAFEAKSQASLIAAIIERTPPPVSHIMPMVPPMLDRIVSKCMDKDPDKRWQSVRDLSDEIRWVAQAGSMAGVPAPLAAKRKLRFTVARAIGAVAIVAFLSVSYLYYQAAHRPQPLLTTMILPDESAKLSDWANGSVLLSPDGTKLVYVASDTSGGDNRLWVRALNSLAAQPLKGTERAYFPFWSPDGEYIAFFSQTKLKKVLATGGPVLTICDVENGRTGCWNKDDIIVYAPNFKGPLYSVPAAGGEPTQLTTLDSANHDYTHRYPFFLPDQDHFLMFDRTESDDGGERDAICYSSLSDPTVHRLFYAKSNAEYADGNILFMRDDILMAQPFDPSSLTLEGNARPLAENVSYNNPFTRGVFSVSQTGHLLYRLGQVNNGATLQIWSDNFNKVDTIGQQELQKTFCLSHDNLTAAVEIDDEQATGSDIWLYDLRRKIKRRFTFGKESEFLPIFTPNDSQIVYGSNNGDTIGIYLKDVYGTSQPELLIATDTRVAPWDWSPDGKYLTYSTFSAGTAFDIFVWTRDPGFTDTVYLQTEFIEGAASVSPDGHWLAYSSNESGEFELYVSTFPKFSSKWQVSTKGGAWAKWTPDGKRLYFIDKDGILCRAEVSYTSNDFQVGSIETLTKIGETEALGFGLYQDESAILISAGEEDKKIDKMVHVFNWIEKLKN